MQPREELGSLKESRIKIKVQKREEKKQLVNN